MSPLSSPLRLESLGDRIQTFYSDWKSCVAPQIFPEQSVVPNMVYTIPPNIPTNISVNHKVLEKASKLSLHPRQEHMRVNIARALVSHKPHSAKTKTKLGRGI